MERGSSARITFALATGLDGPKLAGQKCRNVEFVFAAMSQPQPHSVNNKVNALALSLSLFSEILWCGRLACTVQPRRPHHKHKGLASRILTRHHETLQPAVFSNEHDG